MPHEPPFAVPMNFIISIGPTLPYPARSDFQAIRFFTELLRESVDAVRISKRRHPTRAAKYCVVEIVISRGYFNGSVSSHFGIPRQSRPKPPALLAAK
jgi:hypothetical protein